MMISIWLDDVRPPRAENGYPFVWVKTAREAIALLQTGTVEFASLDHDLGDSVSGYYVTLWLENHPTYWPKHGVRIHSLNIVGAQRMRQVVYNHYKRLFNTLPRENHETCKNTTLQSTQLHARSSGGD